MPDESELIAGHPSAPIAERKAATSLLDGRSRSAHDIETLSPSVRGRRQCERRWFIRLPFLPITASSLTEGPHETHHVGCMQTVSMQISVAPLSAEDREAFVAAVAASRDLHRPWVDPPDVNERFDEWIEHLRRDDQLAYLVRHVACGDLVGYVTVSNIVRRAFQSAHLGYGAFSSHVGRGLMREGLSAVIGIAFEDLGLHRLEANVQPGNAASLGLVRTLGFEREGYSPCYLMVGSEWRDHERWAIRTETWPARTTRAASPS